MYTYSNGTYPRVKSTTKTITRKFDGNENMIEEVVEEYSEYEYVSYPTYPTTTPYIPPYTPIWSSGGTVTKDRGYTAYNGDSNGI